jgi:hypothetical protein
VRQGSLFDTDGPIGAYGRPIEHVPHNGTDTSRAAAEMLAPDVERIRDLVYAAIRDAGKDGVTCEEVEGITGLKHQTASARICDLQGREKGGKALPRRIADSGMRRNTSGGRPAKVWVTLQYDPMRNGN